MATQMEQLLAALAQSQQQTAEAVAALARAQAQSSARQSDVRDLTKPKEFGSEDRERDRKLWLEWSSTVEGYLAAS